MKKLRFDYFDALRRRLKRNILPGESVAYHIGLINCKRLHL